MKLSQKGPGISSNPAILALVPEGMRHYLEADSPDVVRFVVESGSEIEGLILVRRMAGGQWRILVLNTRQKSNRQGIATILVQELMQRAALEKVTKLEVLYGKESPDADFLENVLRGCGWSEPQVRMILFRTTPSRFLEAPFMKKRALPSGFRICRWDDLSDEQLENFRLSQERDSWIPESLLPDKYLKDRHPGLSLALLREKEVVGFQITHLRGDTLHFSCGWVHPDLVGRGRIWSLARVIFEEMAEREIPFGEQRTRVDQFPEMAGFLRTRQRPYAVSYVETYGMEWSVRGG